MAVVAAADRVDQIAAHSDEGPVLPLEVEPDGGDLEALLDPASGPVIVLVVPGRGGRRRQEPSGGSHGKQACDGHEFPVDHRELSFSGCGREGGRNRKLDGTTISPVPMDLCE
jgi:hypothetical protein